MLLNTDAGVVFMVHFHHEKSDHKLYDWITTASMHEGLCVEKKRPCGTQPMVVAVAHSSRKDRFDRAKGRKLSLARAMAAIGIAKQIRQELWADYHKLHPPKPARA
jgi:hypothetical protein